MTSKRALGLLFLLVFFVEITMDPSTSFVRSHCGKKAFSFSESKAAAKDQKAKDVKSDPFGQDVGAHACCGVEELILDWAGYSSEAPPGLISIHIQEFPSAIFQPPKRA